MGKKGGGSHTVESLGGVAIFLRSEENLWDVLGPSQGQFKAPSKYSMLKIFF
jgi:hypothetical protein